MQNIELISFYHSPSQLFQIKRRAKYFYHFCYGGQDKSFVTWSNASVLQFCPQFCHLRGLFSYRYVLLHKMFSPSSHYSSFVPYKTEVLFMISILGCGDWSNPSFCFCQWEEKIYLPRRWEKWFLPNFKACRRWPCNAKEGLCSIEAHLQQPNAYQGWHPWMEWWRGAWEDIASPHPQNFYWRN